MFTSILGSTLTFSSVILCILMALILGMISAFAYMKAGKYSRDFVVTLVLLPMLVAVVMMMVNGSLGTSIAVLGAFSLIRFRSQPGTSKEITYIFLAMGIGLSVGMGQLWFALLITIIANLVLLMLYGMNFGSKGSNRYLKVVVPENLDYDSIFDDILKKYTSYNDLMNVRTCNMGSMYEITYEIKLKDNKDLKKMLDDIRTKNGNMKVTCERDFIDEKAL